MKKLMIILTVAGAMLATSAAHGAVVRVGVGPVRVGVRRAPARRVYVAPRRVIRPAAIRPVVTTRVIRPARPAPRTVIIREHRYELWKALIEALQEKEKEADKE